MHSNINIVLQIHISQTGSGWLLVLFMFVRVYPRAIIMKKKVIKRCGHLIKHNEIPHLYLKKPDCFPCAKLQSVYCLDTQQYFVAVEHCTDLLLKKEKKRPFIWLQNITKFIVFPGLEENSKKNYVNEKKIRGSYNGHGPSVL